MPHPSLASHSSLGVQTSAPDTPGSTATPPVHPPGHRSSHHVNFGSRHVLRDLCCTSRSPCLAVFTQSVSDFSLRSALSTHTPSLSCALCCTNPRLPTRTSTRTLSKRRVRLLDPSQLCYAHLYTTSIILLLAFCLCLLSSIRSRSSHALALFPAHLLLLELRISDSASHRLPAPYAFAFTRIGSHRLACAIPGFLLNHHAHFCRYKPLRTISHALWTLDSSTPVSSSTSSSHLVPVRIRALSQIFVRFFRAQYPCTHYCIVTRSRACITAGCLATSSPVSPCAFSGCLAMVHTRPT
jgi:hypothetical protein